MVADHRAPALDSAGPLIAVRDLTVEFWTGGAYQTVVNHVSFDINAGEAFGLVGESGSGKSTTVYALLCYHQPGSRIREGSVIFQGNDLVHMPQAALQRMRGRYIGFVPQDPTTALTPNMHVGDQILESLRVHGAAHGPAAQRRMVELLHLVGLPLPEQAARKYPHQMSGGQQQRVAIAMALACDPALVILDEPTTGLDVTTQAQILELLARLRAELRLSIAYVSHDLSVVGTICDRVGVMYAGELVEQAPRDEIFQRPRHPYTRALIAAVPRIAQPDGADTLRLPGILDRATLPPGCRFAPRCAFAEDACFAEPQAPLMVTPGHLVACRRQGDAELQQAVAGAASPAQDPSGEPPPTGAQKPTLVVRHLACSYGRSRRWFAARPAPALVVRDVSFTIAQGETFALVGESGSGKSTIAKAIAGIIPAQGGEVLLHDQALSPAMDRRPRNLLRQIQLIPQNPYASLNPRQRIAGIIGRPLQVFFGLSGQQRRQRTRELVDDVRLNATYLSRVPRQLSGGERQRIAIARALAAQPSVLLCDEILSALDVSVQAGVRDLLTTLQAEHGMSYLFISHDLAVVRALAHHVGVLYGGALCEVGRVEEVYEPPYHPYTYVLLCAVPDLQRRQPPAARPVSVTATPSAGKAPACPFAPRCPWKIGSICDEQPPPWRQVSATHTVRCHHPLPTLLALESLAPQEAQAHFEPSRHQKEVL